MFKESSQVAKFFSPKFRQKLFINITNRILLQMTPSPIQPNKWTKINNQLRNFSARIWG